MRVLRTCSSRERRSAGSVRRPRPTPAQCRAGSTTHSVPRGTGAASGTARRSRRAAAPAGSAARPRAASWALRKLTVPDRLSSQPASTQLRAISGPDEKQWKITVSGRALGAQHVEHLGVGVAVVDHQRLAGALGQVDVPRERLALLGRARRSRPACPASTCPCPVSPIATTRGCAASRSISARAASVERVGAGRVQRHRGVHPRVPVGGLRRPSAPTSRSSAIVTTAAPRPPRRGRGSRARRRRRTRRTRRGGCARRSAAPTAPGRVAARGGHRVSPDTTKTIG